eukprot:3558233-Amphidinium_carterae.1
MERFEDILKLNGRVAQAASAQTLNKSCCIKCGTRVSMSSSCTSTLCGTPTGSMQSLSLWRNRAKCKG